VVERQLAAAAEKFVSPAEAAYFASSSLAAHLRKAPRMNPLGEAVADLRVWQAVSVREMEILADKAGMLLADCRGLAPSLKMKAIHDALEGKARQSGIAAAGLINGSGIITLNMWADGLARRELIGIAMFNGGCGCTVPFGGRRGLLGTNPIAYAIPTGDVPLAIDMATSEAPFFEVRIAREKGQPLRRGVAVDQQGRPTTDPKAAMTDDGVTNILPLGGGMKGFGLMMLLEVLTGSLIRSKMSHEQSSGWNPPEYGCFLIAVDIAGFTDLAFFKEQVDAMGRTIRAMEPADGIESVVMPGDRGHAKERAARSAGELEVDDEILRELAELAG
jgi:LDH2 family malate/lactate/ureidoglycolate dehydrogenase